MSKRLINIGVIGCASIAKKSVLPAIKLLHDDFKLIAVSSRSLEKSIEFANEFDCEPVPGYQNLINRNDIEALYIPLPTGLHLEWVGKAIQAGKHIYVEKSFASNLNETNFLIGMAKNKKVVLMEGFMYLYHKQMQFVKNIIENNKIGSLRFFHGSFGFPPLDLKNFRYDEVLGGSSYGCCLLSTVCSTIFLGNNLDVSGSAIFKNANTKTSLWGSAFLKNQYGVGASIAFGFDNFYQCFFEIWGSKGKIKAERAYTAGADFSPKIFLDSEKGNEVFSINPDNHFISALREFKRIIEFNSFRESHYDNILNQSFLLERIKTLSNN